METVAASDVKQQFGKILAMAADGPVGVERHRKLVAAIVPPHWLERVDALDERRAARAAQEKVELLRLLAHQRLGIELLCASAAERTARIAAARREVDRWEAQALCSVDYIARWREWLALPAARLVPLMCSDAEGWGRAMRQNSPFTAPESGRQP